MHMRKFTAVMPR